MLPNAGRFNETFVEAMAQYHSLLSESRTQEWGADEESESEARRGHDLDKRSGIVDMAERLPYRLICSQ